MNYRIMTQQEISLEKKQEPVKKAGMLAKE
jgi:hypothetical protein